MTTTRAGGLLRTLLPVEPGTAATQKEAQPPEKKSLTQYHRRLHLHPKQKGTAESPLRMQKQLHLHHPEPLTGKRTPSGSRKTWRGPEQQAETRQQRPLHRRSHCCRRLRDNGSLGDSTVSHASASHAWFASFLPVTASGQRTEGTGHVTRNGDRSRRAPWRTWEL